MYLLWFNFFLGLNFIFFCFKLIIMSLSYITIPKSNLRKQKFKSRITLNHNIIVGPCSLQITELIYRLYSFIPKGSKSNFNNIFKPFFIIFFKLKNIHTAKEVSFEWSHSKISGKALTQSLPYTISG